MTKRESGKATLKNCRRSDLICPHCLVNEKEILKSGKRSSYCGECNRIRCRDYYLRNKGKLKSKARSYQKSTNYIAEKTTKQRRLRHIKRRTRQLYSLKGHFCEFCGSKAEEHHHNTQPIEIDRFNFVCHSCHVKKHNLKGGLKTR